MIVCRKLVLCRGSWMTHLPSGMDARVGAACALHLQWPPVHIEDRGEARLQLPLDGKLPLVWWVLELEALVGRAIICDCGLVCARRLLKPCMTHETPSSSGYPAAGLQQPLQKIGPKLEGDGQDIAAGHTLVQVAVRLPSLPALVLRCEQRCCQMNLHIHLPQGWQGAARNVTHKAFACLPAGGAPQVAPYPCQEG